MNIVPKVAQAKAALNKNLAVTQSKLAKCVVERDRALGQIQAAVDRAEVAERSARDVERDLRKANELLHALLTNRDAEIERLKEEIRQLHRVYWDGTDLDHAAIAVACLHLFASTLRSPADSFSNTEGR